jgi:hypothetical protein
MLVEEFEAGARDAWQRPCRVVEALRLDGSETVLDLGAGTGYFARHLKRAASRLIAVDPVFAVHLRRRGFEAAETIREVRAPVDLVFAAGVLRFLTDEDRARAAELAPRIVLLDWKPGARPVGPPERDAISMEDAIRAFPEHRAVPMHDFLPYQWMIELRKS